MTNTFPEDEFDRLAAERRAHGAHRRPSRVNPWLTAFIAVLLIAPLFGWGVGSMLTNFKDPEPSPTTTTTVHAEATPEEEATEVVEEPAPEEVVEEPVEDVEEPVVEIVEVEPERNFAVDIRVLNGTRRQGWAADNAATLEAVGYTNVDADNYTSASPTSTTIYYNGADYAHEAQMIGNALGISNIVDGSDISLSASIVVVLR
ncbi:MAG: LytR C-terminal domain-containing protein [Actinomycetaceae bacterium]|nr:LytR C-terminal domain-containing protein [Actinomycetaceae bacterium]